MAKYHLVLGNLEVKLGTPEEVKLLIEKEIGNYGRKAIRAEKWCKCARVGGVFNDGLIRIEVIG